MIRKYKYNNLFSTFLSHFFYMVSWFWLISVYNIAVKWKLHWDCRGCRKFSFWESSTSILLKWDKESPYELHYVFCEETSSYQRVCSFVKFGSDVVCLVNTLGRSGCFFNYISLNEAPFLVFQVLVVLILWRSLWWMVATIDTTGLIYFLYVLRDRALFDWKFFWGQAECH